MLSLEALEYQIDYHTNILHKLQEHYNNLIIEKLESALEEHDDFYKQLQIHRIVKEYDEYLELLENLEEAEQQVREEEEDENRLLNEFVNHPEFKHIFEIWYEHLLIETQPNTKDTSYSKLCFEYDPNDISYPCKRKIYEIYDKYNGYNVIPRLTRYIN